jgi:endonuclease YncB( thermonuclease family)
MKTQQSEATSILNHIKGVTAMIIHRLLRPVLIILSAALLSMPVLSDQAHAQRKGTSKSYKSYKGAKAIDGDTYKYKGNRYRLRDYNAPEVGQPGSKKATQSLQRKLNSGNYEYKSVAKDKYGRSVVKERKKGK